MGTDVQRYQLAVPGLRCHETFLKGGFDHDKACKSIRISRNNPVISHGVCGGAAHAEKRSSPCAPIANAGPEPPTIRQSP